ncbi:hypothetical protein C4D60_Mb04t20960 [Musa balbisiana]|uniref:Uncharacterized protein n=1 Tax=Musa balbisiana TaxID=52838 RepID=A0A4S8KDK0_MUSBA|nr:hypothetical protein C4D60_Mb04t20960 [Musa balbisiana]
MPEVAAAIVASDDGGEVIDRAHRGVDRGEVVREWLSWHRCICSVSIAGHVPRCSDGPGSASILLQLCILSVFRFPQKDNAASQPSPIRWSDIVNSSSIMQHRPMAEIPS